MTTFRGMRAQKPEAFTEDIGFSEDKLAVLDVLDNFQIDVGLFIGNLEYLTVNPISRTISQETALPHTPSVERFKFSHDRPKCPLWAMAAIPDVAHWLDTEIENAAKSGNYSTLFSILGVPPSEQNDEALLKYHNSKSHFNAATYKTIIYSFIRTTGNFPETHRRRPSGFAGLGCFIILGVIALIFMLGYFAGKR